MRDYAAILRRLPDLGGATREARMQPVVDLLWDTLAPTGVSWVGFYEFAPDRESMLLCARRDKPACSPIGLHGACGQAATSGEDLVVRDVAELGEGYIACDPRDRSEVVLPLFDEHGQVWGVLDVDSHDVGSFSRDDAAGLREVMVAAGLSTL